MKKHFSQIFGIQTTSAGFTLIELLVAMALTSIVLSLTGFGLVTIMQKNAKAQGETSRRTELNRALDFIADEVRMANSITTTAPIWATNNNTSDADSQPLDWINNLGLGSPSAKLYVQIPLNVENIDGSADEIDIVKHEFDAGNAVTFTGSGVTTAGLSVGTVYYVTKQTPPKQDSFQVSTSLSDANSGTNIPLNVPLGSLTANRLLIYYIRDHTHTWLPPHTINRSAGPCSTTPNYTESNCPALVDSIAANGFTASVPLSRQVELTLIGKLSKNSTETYQVKTKAFVRANP